MLKENNIIKTDSFTATIGHLFFLILFIYSLVFFKERIIYSDPAFFSFLLIDQNNFSFVLGRWGTIFSQMAPLYGLRHGVSLETFLQLYSASFIVLYYIFFLIIQYVYKNSKGSWILMLSLCLTFRMTFYYSTAELYQGMALSILLWTIVARSFENATSKAWLHTIIASLLILIISFYHQLTLFTVLFILGFELIQNGRFKDKKLLFLVVFTIIWYVIRIKVFTNSEYEKNKMLSGNEFFQQLMHIRDLPSTKYFLGFVKKQILIPVIAFCITLLLLLRKNKLLAIYSGAFFIFFAILICVTLYKGESQMMYENYYIVFGLFIAFSLVHTFSVPSRNFATLAVIILITYSLNQICEARQPITERIEDLNNMIQYGRSLDKRKFLVDENHLKEFNNMLPTWSLPFESTLLSSLDNPAYSVTFFSLKNNTHFTEEQLIKKDVFLGPEWEPFWFTTNSFNKNYFNFPESGYSMLSNSQNSDSFKEASFSKDNIKIDLLKKEILCDEAETYTNIRISNLDTLTLTSIPEGAHPVLISYHLYDESGKLLKWDNSRTILLLDILPGKSLVQKVNIDYPGHPGKYKVNIDFVTEGIRWWGISNDIALIAK